MTERNEWMKRAHGTVKGRMPLNVAISRFSSAVNRYCTLELETEEILISDGLGRVISSDLKSDIDIPSFNKAAMDGYAVCSSDTKMSSKKHPTVISVGDSLAAGELDSKRRVKHGTSIRVATGASIPPGADAVIRFEDVSLIGSDKILVTTNVGKTENVSLKGEDIRDGTLLFPRGTWLNPAAIALIASTGRNKIKVFCKPRVAILSTGDEIIEPGSKCRQNSVFDSNRYLLSALVRQFGGEPIDLGICADNETLIFDAISKGLQYDLIIASGGSSVGMKDYLPRIIAKIGNPGLIVNGVSMKPGSPTALGVINGKPIVICPGFPVSAFAAFNSFVPRLLLGFLKTRGPAEPRVFATVQSDVYTKSEVTTLIRFRVCSTADNKYLAYPISAADSRLLSTLAKADGFVTIEDKEGLTKGEVVELTMTRAAKFCKR